MELRHAAEINQASASGKQIPMWSVPTEARNEANSARRPPQLNGASIIVCAIKRTVCAMQRTVFGEDSGLYRNAVSLDRLLSLARSG